MPEVWSGSEVEGMEIREEFGYRVKYLVSDALAEHEGLY
jgi:hypothetical protein